MITTKKTRKEKEKARRGKKEPAIDIYIYIYIYIYTYIYTHIYIYIYISKFFSPGLVDRGAVRGYRWWGPHLPLELRLLSTTDWCSAYQKNNVLLFSSWIIVINMIEWGGQNKWRWNNVVLYWSWWVLGFNDRAPNECNERKTCTRKNCEER